MPFMVTLVASLNDEALLTATEVCEGIDGSIAACAMLGTCFPALVASFEGSKTLEIKLTVDPVTVQPKGDG